MLYGEIVYYKQINRQGNGAPRILNFEPKHISMLP